VVLAFITSRVSAAPLATDLVLGVDDPSFHLTGLRVPSMVQLHRLMTATTELVRRDLGTLSPTMQAAVKDRLRALFNLT
jgi:mRNA interferase MazF